MMDALIITLCSVGAFLVLSFGIFLFLIKPNRKREGMDEFVAIRYAHRGLHNEARPENSMSAFKAALDAGYAIELDVRLSSDGELVVFHDDTLDRVTSESGRVDARTAEELSKLHLLGTDDTIPAFKDVLALVDGRVDFSNSKNMLVVSIVLSVGLGLGAVGLAGDIVASVTNYALSGNVFKIGFATAGGGFISISPLAIATILAIVLNLVIPDS